MVTHYTREEFELKIKRLEEEAEADYGVLEGEGILYSAYDEIELFRSSYIDDGLYFLRRDFKELLDRNQS